MDINLITQSLPTAPPKRDNINQKFETCYAFGDTLGQGAYGVVKKCTNLKTNQDFAVKVISKRIAGQKGLRAVYSEVEILQILKHPNIVELVETFESSENLYIVLELVLGGELLTQVAKLQRYSENIVKKILASLFHAVDFMHKKGVVHRDLKPSNLLFSRSTIESEVKVADFGFSKLIGEESCLSGLVGTVSYMAPEVLQGDSYGKVVDVWSCGVIAYQLLGGVLPFIARTEDELLRRIYAGHQYPNGQGWFRVSPEAKEMIDNLLQPDPYKRWPASHALLHPWIRIGSPSHGNEHLSECHENLVRYVNREPPKVFPTDDPANGRDRQRKAKANSSLEHTALVPAREMDDLDTHEAPEATEDSSSAGIGILDQQLEELFRATQMDYGIQKLQLPNLGISDAMLIKLVKCIVDHPSITEVDLSWNPLTAASARALLRLVRQNTTLRHINLAGTKIPHDVMCAITDITRKRWRNLSSTSDRMPMIATTHSLPQNRPANNPTSPCSPLIRRTSASNALGHPVPKPVRSSYSPPIRPLPDRGKPMPPLVPVPSSPANPNAGAPGTPYIPSVLPNPNSAGRRRPR